MAADAHPTSEPNASGPAAEPTRAAMGIAGLDAVLGGGLLRRRMYVIEGAAGAGKTTLALHVMLAGRVNHERGLSHGWSLAGIDVLALSMAAHMARPEQQQTLFRPSHVELDEPFPAVASPLGQESGQLSGVFPSGVCLYHLQTSRPIGIGS